MSETTAPAATATTTTTAIEHESNLNKMTQAERATWRSTGALPERKSEQAPQQQAAQLPQQQEQKPATQAADQAQQGAQQAAQQADQATQGDDGKPYGAGREFSNRQRYLNSLVTRAVGAEQENARLKAEIEQLRGGGQGQQQAGQQQAGQQQQPKPQGEPRPRVEDFDSYEQYEDAAYEWRRKQERAAEQTQQQQQQAQSAQVADEQQLAVWVERRAAFEAANPDFVEKAGPLLNSLLPGGLLYKFLVDSEIGPAVAYALATNQAEMDRIDKLSPARALIELGKLEDKIASAKPASNAAPAASNAKPETKLVSDAPPPSPSLGSNPNADTADPEAAAVASGNFSAFMTAANARELASSRR